MGQHREEIDVSTWEEFEGRLKTIRQNPNFEGSTSPFLFRGQDDSAWKLTTTLERIKRQGMLFNEYYRLISRIKPQIEGFTDNRWEIPEYPEVEGLAQEYDAFSLALSSGRLPAYPYMVYLRHHAFPSPLLDWTQSPHVAAYFAFVKADSKEKATHVSIYVCAEARFQSGSNQNAMIFRLGPYVRAHRRHFLQQCEYTVCFVFNSTCNEWRFGKHEEVFDADHYRPGTLWKFNIPSTERPKVMKLLNEYNLNAFSLFESEESLMETMAFREFRDGSC